MSGPHVPYVPRDADPLDVSQLDEAYAMGFEDGWDSTKPKPPLLGYVVVAISGAIVGALLTVAAVTAAPRPAQTTERVDLSALASAGPTPAPTLARPETGPREASGTSASSRPPTGTRLDAPSPSAVAGGTPRPSMVTEPPAAEGGVASWYDDGPGLYAAVPSFSWGDRPYRVTVHANGRSVVVTIRDHCQCYVGTSRERLIDLSPVAFARLAPLSRGVVVVAVEGLRG